MRKILIADDHLITRKGLEICCRKVFDKGISIIECESMKEVFTQLRSDSDIKLLLLDIFMDDKSSLVQMNMLRRLNPQLLILVISAGKDEIYGLRSMMEGANGYINKTADESDLCRAIRQVGDGNYYFTNEILRKSAELLAGRSDSVANPFLSLSNQEFNILIYMLKGYSTSEIGDIMSLKPTTVSTFKSRIYEKLNTSRLNELLKMAADYNIIIN